MAQGEASQTGGSVGPVVAIVTVIPSLTVNQETSTNTVRDWKAS